MLFLFLKIFETTIDKKQYKCYKLIEVKKMKKNKDFAEITSLRIQAGLRHKDLAKLVGYSAFWFREKIYNGDKDVIQKAKSILYKRLS